MVLFVKRASTRRRVVVDDATSNSSRCSASAPVSTLPSIANWSVTITGRRPAGRPTGWVYSVVTGAVPRAENKYSN